MSELGPNSVIPVISAAWPIFPRKRKSLCDLAMSRMSQRTNPLARERAVREGRSQWRQWSDEASRIG